MVFFAITSELRGTPESKLEPFVTAWTVQRTGENNNSMSSQVVGDRFDQLFTGALPLIGLTPFATVHYWNRRSGVQDDFPMSGMLSQFRDSDCF